MRTGSAICTIVFSLPTQRCFLGIRYSLGDSLAFLCLRRGVSTFVDLAKGLTGFSLPTQRCFPDDVREPYDDGLFSAYAEVFPPRGDAGSSAAAFLCLRRGVSVDQAGMARYSGFSLPTQRCFQSELWS